jgi:hypothetical protein
MDGVISELSKSIINTMKIHNSKLGYLWVLFYSGLYVNEIYQVFPRASNIRCKEKIRNSLFYKFGVTRTIQGEVTLFLNGGKCQAGKPEVSENLALDAKNVVFFHDDGSENPSGAVS